MYKNDKFIKKDVLLLQQKILLLVMFPDKLQSKFLSAFVLHVFKDRIL